MKVYRHPVEKCKDSGDDYCWEGGTTQSMMNLLMDLLSIINLQRWWIKGEPETIIIVFFYVSTWYTNSHFYRTMEMMMQIIVTYISYPKSGIH